MVQEFQKNDLLPYLEDVSDLMNEYNKEKLW